jgi:hypothetical protein
MFRWLRNRYAHKPTSRPQADAAPPRPALETLEDRIVPTVVYNGGALLQHVEVQGLYLGSDWYYNSSLYNMTGQLEGFLHTVVNSSYMDALTNAGYGVGRGSAVGGRIGLVNLNPNFYLTDSAIQSDLQAYISNGGLQAPDANRLYVIFVEDNIAVRMSDGSTSQSNFLGYHGAFAGRDAFGNAADIHYAVITYPGGGVGNAAIPNSTVVDQLTEVASHEIAEAATDPNVNYRALGWYDNQQGEIGDITAGQRCYVGGYAVQRLADQNDQAMTPASATGFRPATFVLIGGGYLYEHTSAGWTFLASGIASVSDQGIDLHGRTVVDVVTAGGYAYEYHDGAGFVFLTGGARSAVAGQGASYVLLTNGYAYEHHDAGNYWSFVWYNVSSISAGTDRLGVNMVDVVFTNGAAYERSDESGWRYLMSGVQSASAGRGGHTELLTQGGNAFVYLEAYNYLGYITSGVSQLTAGYDANGNLMIDLVFGNGAGYEYRTDSGWNYLASGIQSVSKADAGVVDILFSGGYLYTHDSGGWTFLTTGAVAAA